MVKKKVSLKSDVELEKLKKNAVNSLKTVLLKYPFIPLDSAQIELEVLVIMYYGSLMADDAKIGLVSKKANDEWIALGKIDFRKLKHISFKFKGKSKTVNVESKVIIFGFFKAYETIIKNNSNGIQVFKGSRATNEVKNVAKRIYDYLKSDHNDNLSSDYKKFKFIAEFINCATLEFDGVIYTNKSIQALLKPSNRK